MFVVSARGEAKPAMKQTPYLAGDGDNCGYFVRR